MRNRLIEEICISLLILLFSYTAISKFLDQYRFVFQMKLSPFVLVREFAQAWGWIIPFAEIVIVLGLLVERTRQFALLASVCLLLIFEIYIVAMLLTGLKLPCACGGVIAFMSWEMHIVFNAFFITINIVAIKIQRRIRMANNIT